MDLKSVVASIVFRGICLNILLFCGATQAQEPTPANNKPVNDDNVILVLDASRSMWGRIDDEPKIVAAKRVVGDLLQSLPNNKRLGLVAYGHRRKADCGDIEEIAPIGADRETIRNAMENVGPKGKTPLSGSVKFAAERLQYREEKASVILVSDGIETCDLDPCAVGSELERTGADFTVHVIGFDIAADQDQAQLQCLAENTGGRYWNASTADELAKALEETVAATPQSTGESGLFLRATALAGGPVIEKGLRWLVRQADGGETVYSLEDGGNAVTTLPPGNYDIFVERRDDGIKGQALNIKLRTGARKTVVVPLALSFDASVRIEPEPTSPAGGDIIVYWTGPDRQADYITIARKDAPKNVHNDYAYTSKGNRVKLETPVEPGDYEVRYILGRPPQVLATTPLTLTSVEATLSAAPTVNAGQPFQVAWTGPGQRKDWVAIVKPDARDTAFVSYAHPQAGQRIELTAPLEPGDYELRYVQAGEKILVRRAITVNAAAVTLTGPAQATIGSRHEISWIGPQTQGDWITIVKPDAPDSRYTTRQYTRKGSPQRLRMPLEPGHYELRYVQAGNKTLARQPVFIEDATATLDAPDKAVAGGTLQVEWTGPAGERDWISVVEPTAAEDRNVDYEYVRKSPIIELELPVEPGLYEVRYVLDGRRVLARMPVSLTQAEASLTAPVKIAAGQSFEIQWTGPGFQRDFVTITKRDHGDKRFTDYEYAQRGSPTLLRAPTEPGAYEIRYVLRGKKVIARRAITVE